MDILSTIKEFLTIQDWRLIIAGFGMVLIFLVMIYSISLIVLSFQKRRDAVDVHLPDILTNNDEHDESNRFKEKENLEVELIDANDDIVGTLDNKDDSDEAFLRALSIESRKLILPDQRKLDMPEVGEIDYEGIKMMLENNAKERKREDLERLKKIALSDEQDFIDMSLINDNGGAFDE